MWFASYLSEEKILHVNLDPHKWFLDPGACGSDLPIHLQHFANILCPASALLLGKHIFTALTGIVQNSDF